MKTLIFCTSYASNMHVWETRQALWVRSLQQSDLDFDQLLIVDDASPVLPDWSNLEILHEATNSDVQTVSSDADIVLFRFAERLGRQDLFVFPGWYRSYSFGALYGFYNGFDKVIHIESDAHLVSKRIYSFFNEVDQGWFALWCQKYQMPEIAIQVAAGADLLAMVDFVQKPYDQLSGRLHETLIPFSHIEKGFLGDRYGEEDLEVPANADFSAQTRLGKPDEYYWWIAPDQSKRRIMECAAPFPQEALSGGWSIGEPGLHWMTNYESSMSLAPVPRRGKHLLQMKLFPCLAGSRTSQKIYVIINRVIVDEVELLRYADLSILIPDGLLNENAENKLLMFHPDAIVPSNISDLQESRNLSIGLLYISLYELYE